jgi:hypothetical protein
MICRASEITNGGLKYAPLINLHVPITSFSGINMPIQSVYKVGLGPFFQSSIVKVLHAYPTTKVSPLPDAD